MPELYARNSRFQKSHWVGRSALESRSQALRIRDQSRSTPPTSARPLQRKSARARAHPDPAQPSVARVNDTDIVRCEEVPQGDVERSRLVGQPADEIVEIASRRRACFPP